MSLILELFDYQRQAVEELRTFIRRGVKRLVLCLPTGAGKTFVAMFLVRSGLARDRRVYFVCDRQTLVDQTSMRFTEHGIPHGVLMGDQSKRLWENIIVVSAQTLESRGFAWLMPARGLFEATTVAPDPDFVIIDECHEMRKKLLKHIVDRDILLLGLSATPFGAGMSEVYEEVVNCTTTSKLMQSGVLVPLEVVAPPGGQVDIEGVRTIGGEYSKADLSERVLRIVGDVVKTWEVETLAYFGGPVATIGFYPSVVDTLDAVEKFQAAGHDFQAVTGQMKAEEKRGIIEAFRRGEHIGLLTCAVLTKGFDVPLTRVMIDAYPLRRSLMTHIQRLGRVIRSAPDKKFALLLDFADNFAAFAPEMYAFFDTGCEQLNEERAKGAKRLSATSTSTMKCHECGYVWPRQDAAQPPITECPSCGAARKRGRGRLQMVGGTLVHVDTVDGTGRSLPWDGDWWVELCAVASRITKDDEKAQKIALAKFRGTFGRWPNGREFERVDRKPNPKVASYTERQYRRWRKQKA